MFSELSRELLPIYLNDHLAGATAGSDLAHRAAGANEGSELGDFLADFAGQLEADKAQLEDVMARLDIGRDPLKVGAGWLAEKLGRLKLNGRLLEYSPLSRVIELEGLIAGVSGKRMLWLTLAAAAPDEPRIADIDFTQLVERADEQLEGLTTHHAGAVETMLDASRRTS
jgi:hypothetical protein